MKSWMMFHIENARLKNLTEAFLEDRKIDFFLQVRLSLQACEVGELKRLWNLPGRNHWQN